MHYFATLFPKILAYILYGIAGKLLWQWFVAETFDIVNLPWSTAFGITILVRLTNDHYTPRSKEDYSNLLRHTIYTPLIATALGFILYRLKGII
ncbi:MAG: hypothetical protein FJZ43_01100 [Candidatus Staskawiczbacteria bacterium]|nr:hypothetical protein [Candidatus Staskawiczbacteria bacterium]